MTALKTKVRFILLRLEHLSAPEVFSRLGQIARMYYVKISGKKPLTSAVNNTPMQGWKLPSIQGMPSSEEIMRIISGERYTLNYDQEDIETFEKGHRVFSANKQSQHKSVDIRAVWEPARLQYVYMLLQSLQINSKAEFASMVESYAREQILEWINKNPFLKGPHYQSVMECGLRIPVFLYALVLLSNLSEADRRKIIDTIYEHAWLISMRLSLYSSLGNHTICECMGLIFASFLFMSTDEGRAWLEKGIHLLDTEIYHQILDDGGPAEQSLNYHRFVLDLYWMAVGLLEKNGLYDCLAWKQRLLRGETFMAAFTDRQGNIPAIGDSDDGHAIAPGLMPERPTVVADEKTYQVFPAAGYTIIRGGNKTRLIFDHGPLGMAPLYNHGHADALSIILYKEETPLLIDPGTYRYNGVPQWREYFKSTRAHNTVTIDGLDQAVQETGFIWSRPYSVDGYAVHETASGVDVQARHNGYSRIQHPVWHKRAISIGHNRYTIVDTFEGSGVHDYELNFHLHPDAVAFSNGSGWVIDNSHVTCTIALKDGSEFRQSMGKTDPILGWFSPAYGVKRETTVLSCRKRGRPEGVSFLTEITV
jgi:hypothetical protein